MRQIRRRNKVFIASSLDTDFHGLTLLGGGFDAAVRIENAHKLSNMKLSQRADDLPTVAGDDRRPLNELLITDYSDYTDVSRTKKQKRKLFFSFLSIFFFFQNEDAGFVKINLLCKVLFERAKTGSLAGVGRIWESGGHGAYKLQQ